jgi:hypothetical protein
MSAVTRLLHLRLEEGGDEFILTPLRDGLSNYTRNDILLCRCNRPLILNATYAPSGRNEGSILCALASRDEYGSLLRQGSFPAVVNVLTVRPHVTSEVTVLTDEDGTFAYTGVLREA